MNTDLRSEVFQQAFRAVKQQLPHGSRIQVSQPELHHIYEIYVPQILYLHAHSLWPQPRIPLPFDFAEAVKDCGTFMWHNRQHAEGEKALQTAKEILKELQFTETDPVYGDIDGTLGVMADMTGISRRGDSIYLRNNVARIREREYASIPPDKRTIEDTIRLYNAKADYALLLLLDEKAEEAIAVMEDCQRQYTQWGSEDQFPFEFAKYYNHSGLAFMQLGETARGVEFSKRACELQVAHGGPNAPLSLMYYFVLGNQYYMNNEIENSLQLNRRILENRRQVCGQVNPSTLESFSFTGSLLFFSGQAEEAR
jgi:hypothetical protein